jgi:hydrogenase maturation protein HypF
VHRLATSIGLAGTVINDPEGATIEVEGPRDLVERFVDQLDGALPPLARVDGRDLEPLEPTGDTTFEVRQSSHGARAGALIPADAALCVDCRRDMEDPNDRRHCYAFTTCTNCGPRFSLVHHLPYDRERTAMACFPLCEDCQREYDDPGDRRFHAEPVCCPDCGPRLWLQDAGGSVLAEGPAALAEAQAALLGGAIVAIKALGGFQLACRADLEHVVVRLRERKRRPSKPFAIMARDLGAAGELVHLTGDDRTLLSSPRSPIVLAPKRFDSSVAASVAPGLDDLGVLVPTTPLHVELFREPAMPPLVMTSANASEEPICRGNREAVDRLSGFADLFLMHDRDVVRRVDDSVVRSGPMGPIMLRRARGWVPDPVLLPDDSPQPVLAVGGHLQVTACLASQRQAFPSQHVGDLDSEPARAFLREVIDGLEDFLECRATCIVADLHPDYPSTWLARELAAARDARLIHVQHHLAHAAAVLAEHGRFPDRDESVLAVSLDGTGWGSDGTSWGGEWLSLDGNLQWSRRAHLQLLPLVGGERAVREPWRVAAAALSLAGAEHLLERLPLAASVDSQSLHQVATLAGGGPWPAASGAGRLFEAAGALLGLAVSNTWEGEAAARLEAAATRGCDARAWPEVHVSDAPVLPSTQLLAAAAHRIAAGESIEQVAAGVHATFCSLAVELVRRVAGERRVVAIGGGCLVNRLLVARLDHGLREAGFEPLFARRLPPGDGGLSYGQAVLASVALARGLELS